MPKNTTDDLNNILFEQLERLNDTDITGDELKQEMERAKSIAMISEKLISNGALKLASEKLNLEYGITSGTKKASGFLGANS